MHPLLAEAAFRGNLRELTFLLNRREEQPDQEFLYRLAAYRRSLCLDGDVQEQVDIEEGPAYISAAWLLKGVTTVEGNTALHVVAGSGNYVDCADLIHGNDKHLLCVQNNKGDTPLHCAVRARRSRMVSHLVDLATRDNMVEQLLRSENKSKETALHDAVRIGDADIVKELLRVDPELACFPKKGTSPLYLAVLLGRDSIALTLHDETTEAGKLLSYSGPDGQNALHAAVLRGPVATKIFLGWNKELATKTDECGSTPLHFAAGLPGDNRRTRRADLTGAGRRTRRMVYSQVCKANKAALYQADNNGMTPIHVAASVDAIEAILIFVEEEYGTSSSAGLRDAKGRTFLHVAVEKN
ncbi:hypothetical protein E2562_020806 [Oryza meyeriana var. granulata]|uniref:Uncharacterized protein n=1 Tax=Oryza meyeriana var. granulata TaxID=110450 RepID=A0A6G1CG58_9ORYZ|nr:hypothetical protein E2562_020806 [Oryza meyeriana var. granulata]